MAHRDITVRKAWRQENEGGHLKTRNRKTNAEVQVSVYSVWDPMGRQVNFSGSALTNLLRSVFPW